MSRRVNYDHYIQFFRGAMAGRGVSSAVVRVHGNKYTGWTNGATSVIRGKEGWAIMPPEPGKPIKPDDLVFFLCMLALQYGVRLPKDVKEWSC